MQVKCTICDNIESIDDHSFEAKRLRNRRIHMYLCQLCYERIEHKTKQRHATEKFRLYTEKKASDDFI
ncbi:YlaI family protein [Virgibacillus salarius]|uniref:YlaI family protein n=1 Tax=Virgibacillus salarius TaxID=447199 RepID=UPI0024934022|nr:YlaI family protein [Virgibacillus salarius]WBX79685.1 YlaI family protein [Virgibacillus salarius]